MSGEAGHSADGPSQSIAVLERPPDVSVRVPGSKSHTNRALICAALAAGESTLDRVLLADDTEAMIQLLVDLGIDVQVDRRSRRATILGVDGRVPDHEGVLDARQSGTTSRFVLPMLALGHGRYVLDGHEQMRARPFGDLIGALESLGACVEGDTLPLTVFGSGGFSGGTVAIPGSVSSQFLSALLLSAPYAADTVHIEIVGDLVSKPYIDLTLATMGSFGVDVDRDDHRSFTVPPQGYRAAEVSIEPDASAASYFFAAAAVTGGRVRVDGLGTSTLQGDLRFVDVLERMGAKVTRTHDATEVEGTGRLHGIDVDMSDISDTAQTLAAIAPFADGPVRIRGIGFIRRKETDRIAAMVTELRRLGIDAIEDDNGLTVHPGRPRPGRVETYHDHRMAMSFAILGLVAPGIEIADPACVEKTFPDFFEVLDSL
jgi:3-phosphoshikimate 1-carboxyvinyltransferase